MTKIVQMINSVVWGVPALLLILGVGIYLSIQTNFVQFRLFPKALQSFLGHFKRSNNAEGGSSYRALCTALAATVGTGNIAGVAGAITIGGPGAIFWMWICALLGMVTKFAEAALAVRYCQKNLAGEYVGGPMYMIEKAIPRWKWMACIYCFFGAVAAFGVGNATQINAVIGGVNSIITFLGGNNNTAINLFLGLIFAVLILYVFVGGATRIGTIAEKLIPYAAGGYMVLCCVALIARIQVIPSAFSQIFCGAFSPKAVTGGIVGSAVVALRVGASRGVFTNEAGMGTAAIAHATSNVEHPVEQGLMGIMEVFLDTIVICTMTALVILCSGAPIPYGLDTGILLTTDAFAEIFGEWICIPITVFLCCFAVATIIGWGLYGVRCIQYLIGEKSWKGFACLQAVTALFSAALGTGMVWLIAETVNGLMAMPNLIVLAYLTPELRRLCKEYRGRFRAKRV